MRRPATDATPSSTARRRWVLNLVALPLLPASTVAGAVIVPWYWVYGSWSPDGHELDGLVDMAHALGVGLLVWPVVWLLTWLGPRSAWRILLLGCLLTPAVVVNVLTFRAAREQVCQIRAANGRDDRLHDLPWPMALGCPFRPGVISTEKEQVTS